MVGSSAASALGSFFEREEMKVACRCWLCRGWSYNLGSDLGLRLELGTLVELVLLEQTVDDEME